MIKLLLFIGLFASQLSESSELSESSIPSHPLKMCVCDVKHQPESGQLAVKFKFFWDDLEATLEKQTGQNLDLKMPSIQTHQVLDAFVKQHYHLKINGQAVPLRILRSEFQDPVLVVEWVVDNFRAAHAYQVELSNQILLDVFPDQYNLVRFDFFGDGNLETMRFERAERFLSKNIVKR